MESKFKIGDVVVCIDKPISTNIGSPNYPGGGYKLGYRFVVKEITTGNHGECLWSAYNGNGVYSKFVEHQDKVTPEMIGKPAKKTKYLFK